MLVNLSNLKYISIKIGWTKLKFSQVLVKFNFL